MSLVSSEFDHVVIKLDDHGKGSVSINGHPLRATESISLEACGSKITIVTIRLVSPSVEFDGPAVVTLEGEG